MSEAWSTAAAVLTSIGGGGFIVLVLSSWLGKIWANRLMGEEKAKHNQELEKLRADLGKTVHVHGAQFEREFSAYEEIWKHLIEVKRAVLQLRPMMDYVDPGETKEERQERRLANFGKHFRAYRDSVDKNRPFYAPVVWEQLQDLKASLHGEAVDYQYTSREEAEYWKEAMENSKEISEQIDRICTAIRSRLEKLAIVE